MSSSIVSVTPPKEEQLEEIKAPVMTERPKKIELGEWFPPIKVGTLSGYAGKETFSIDDSWEFWGSKMIEYEKEHEKVS